MTDFKVKQVVTRPVLKLEKEKTLYVRITEAMFTGTAPAQRAGSTRTPVAPWLANVTVLPGKTDATLPVHPKLKALFDRAYPTDKYIGKCFAITAKNREAGRQFAPFFLAEIEDPDGEAAPAETHTGAATTKKR